MACLGSIAKLPGALRTLFRCDQHQHIQRTSTGKLPVSGWTRRVRRMCRPRCQPYSRRRDFHPDDSNDSAIGKLRFTKSTGVSAAGPLRLRLLEELEPLLRNPQSGVVRQLTVKAIIESGDL